jgi:hypothetical protein
MVRSAAVLIDEVVRALNERTWPDHVARDLGPSVGETVAPYLRLVIGAAVEAVMEDGGVPLGASKVGGLPHVDDDFQWPTEDGTDDALALVCQVNLAEAPTSVRGLPDRGMLYLFTIYDPDRAYGYEIDETTTKLVYVREPGPMAVAVAPDDLAEDGVLPERRLTLGPALLAEESTEDGGYREARFDYDVERAIDEEVVRRGGAPCGVVRLLGHAYPFRAETRELFDADSAILLLYVNGYAVGPYAWGEGDFHVVVDGDALASGRLAEAEVLFEPGT